MNTVSIVIIVVLAVLLSLAITHIIKNKGKCNGCDGNCQNCSKYVDKNKNK